MDDAQILDSLRELAREAGMRVRIAGRGRGGDDDLPVASGVCRVRGEIWVVLSTAEPPPVQIATLAQALCKYAGPLLEQRHLPPAVRACIEPPLGPTVSPA